jgi:hypothetical protein
MACSSNAKGSESPSESATLSPTRRLLRSLRTRIFKRRQYQKATARRYDSLHTVNQYNAISAFIALYSHAFSRLRFEEIPSLIDLILPRTSEAEVATVGPPTGSDGPGHFHVADALVSLSKWFMDFQSAYDGKPWGGCGAAWSTTETGRRRRLDSILSAPYRPKDHGRKYEVGAVAARKILLTSCRLTVICDAWGTIGGWCHLSMMRLCKA